jgi:hypothetical protein
MAPQDIFCKDFFKAFIVFVREKSGDAYRLF